MTGTIGLGTFTVTFAQAHMEKPAPLELHVDVPAAPSLQLHDTCVPGLHCWRGAAKSGDTFVVGSAFAVNADVQRAAAIVSEGKSFVMCQLLASSGFIGFSSQKLPIPKQSMRVRR